MPPLRLQQISRMPELPNPSAREHLHGVHELVLVWRGSYAARIGAERCTAEPGDSLYYPAGLRHTPLTGAGQRGQLCVIRWQGESCDPQPRQQHDHDGRLRLAADWLWHLAQTPDTAPPAVLDGLLVALLHQRSREQREEPDELFTRAHRYLSANLAYHMSLTELAAAVDVSPATLRRCFCARAGEPPMRYRRRLRVERICALLRAGDRRPLSELAPVVGFANAFHCSRAVRDLTGRPPSAWRSGRPG